MITERLSRITPSATIELEGIVADLEAKGVHVVGLNAGEPDFPTPANIVRACFDAVEAQKTKYISVTGIPELRKAICEKLLKDDHVSYAPDQIVVSTGAKQALYNTVLALVAPGDEVIIPSPCWVSYVEMVRLAEGKAVLVDLNKDYSLNVENIEKAVTPRTKAVIINTPNNPTGAVYDEASLRALGELAVRHNFTVISDEVYEKLVYDDNRHVCIASFSDEIKAHCVIINGFSKAYAMTGWRIGYSCSTREIAKGISALQGHTTSNSTTFVQWAALEALTGDQSTVEKMRLAFDERRKFLFKRLNEIPGIHCGNAQGAFYLMPDVSYYYGKRVGDKVIKDSVDLCAYLLEEAHLAVVPGSAFFAPDTIRIAYSNSIDNIAAGMDHLEKALSKLH